MERYFQFGSIFKKNPDYCHSFQLKVKFRDSDLFWFLEDEIKMKISSEIVPPSSIISQLFNLERKVKE